MSVARSSIQRQKEEEEEEENGNEEVEEQGETESEEEDESDGVDLEEGRRKRVMVRVVCGEGSGVSSSCIAASSSSSSSSSLCCQADECGLELKMAKPYHKRHKVCERHAKAAVVLVNGLRKRFCQQCSRFHEISEFDGIKKSCRERLAGHNRRRRKAHSDLHEKMDRNHQRPE